MSNEITPSKSSSVPASKDPDDTAARQHFSRLAQIAQAKGSAVIITDVEGVTVWVNEGFTRITGYAFEEAVGRTPGRLLQGPETDRVEAARIGAALLLRQSVASELINYAKDGRRYWVGMKIEPLRDAHGEVDGFMAMEADITERHEARQSLERMTRRFDMATRAAHVGFSERDANLEIVWWSDVTFEIFGQDPAAFTPTNDTWLELIQAEDREGIRGKVIDLAKSLGPVDWNYRIVRSDGEMRHIQSMGAPAESQSASVQGANAFYFTDIDVTARIHAEQREEALQGQLREKSHQAGMAEIATGVLHNVGNLLNSLSAANTTARSELQSLRLDRLEQATNLLRSNRDTLAAFLTDDDRGRHLPDYLTALSAHMTRSSLAIRAELDATEQFLRHLSDIVSAQQEMAGVGGRCESLRLDELVDTALLVHFSELARIEVVREYEELPVITTDRHKLLQIVVNLISNSIHAVQECATCQPRVALTLARDGDHARLTVEDSGIGMSDEILSKIWRFGFTTKPTGHGFGLHNSANAAHEIGATIAAHSDGVGKGSRFTLRLPLQNREPLPSGAAA